ncbi:unnamed protein product [Meloidogyne enterolobii]|uniref:Uncharacterized protein n=1 Tax=Meloidogyne enterolobii TaxID=390850 RepID=A0ACB0ZKM3_MELEN
MTKVIFVFFLLAFLTLANAEVKHLIGADCTNIHDPRIFEDCQNDPYMYDCIARKCSSCCHPHNGN